MNYKWNKETNFTIEVMIFLKYLFSNIFWGPLSKMCQIRLCYCFEQVVFDNICQFLNFLDSLDSIFLNIYNDTKLPTRSPKKEETFHWRYYHQDPHEMFFHPTGYLTLNWTLRIVSDRLKYVSKNLVWR